jgi:hypothetical protein
MGVTLRVTLGVTAIPTVVIGQRRHRTGNERRGCECTDRISGKHGISFHLPQRTRCA